MPMISKCLVRPCVLACLFDGKKNPEECTKECRPVCKALTQGTQELKKALKLKKGKKLSSTCFFCAIERENEYINLERYRYVWGFKIRLQRTQRLS